ncbi:MAG: flavodoxin [Erysipelotrichaceae bacterium]|nr:flavodoxin [Erysipelotrichaceae bacterium]
MNKTLITYFSCSSNTRNVALKLKEILKGDIFEIEPSIPYTDADLNWENENSRSSIEMKNASARPDIKNKINIADYETIYLGFPIWWYTAPRIINTFLESYDFTNKKVYLFATSGGSNLDNTYLELTKLYPNINFIKTRVFSPSITTSELEKELNN